MFDFAPCKTARCINYAGGGGFFCFGRIRCCLHENKLYFDCVERLLFKRWSRSPTFSQNGGLFWLKKIMIFHKVRFVDDYNWVMYIPLLETNDDLLFFSFFWCMQHRILEFLLKMNESSWHMFWKFGTQSEHLLVLLV